MTTRGKPGGTPLETAARRRQLRAIESLNIWTRAAHKDPEAAIRAFGRLWTRYRDASEPELQRLAAGAMYNRANTLARGAASEEAIGAYSEVIERFGRSDDLSTEVTVAMAMFNKGVGLRDLGRTADEVDVCMTSC